MNLKKCYMEILNRIEVYLAENRLSRNALAKALGIAQTTLNAQLSGKATLAASVVSGILLNRPSLSAEWLIRGIGPMYLSETRAPSGAAIEVETHGANSPAVGVGNVGMADNALLEQLRKENDYLKAQLTAKDARIDRLIGLLEKGQ